MERLASLFRECADGRDPEAWERFVGSVNTPLRRRLRRALRRACMWPEPEKLDDLLQETYCHLLERGAAAFKGESDAEVLAYLGKIADNTVIDRFRADSAQKRCSGPIVPGLDPDTFRGIRDPEANPEERFLAKERKRIFLSFCQRVVRGRLAQRDLALLQWSVLDGWTSREISGALKGRLCPSSVDSQLHRLRRRLADRGMQVPTRMA